MASDHEHDAVRSATPESLERARAQNRDGGEGEPVDGAAEPDPGTVPEGATPATPATPGDPLADAHEEPGAA